MVSKFAACYVVSSLDVGEVMAFVSVTTMPLTFPFLLHFFQNSLIKRIKGENVYVKHSNLMLEVGIGIYQCMFVCVDFFLVAFPCPQAVMHEPCTSPVIIGLTF